MSAVWFRAPLTCLHCGSRIAAQDTRLHTTGLGRDATDDVLEPGEVYPLTAAEFNDGYFVLRDPGTARDVLALEQWSCPVCGRAQWAELEFHREDAGGYRFVGARSVPLTPETLRHANFVSRNIDFWLESNPGPAADAIREVLGPLLAD